MNYIFPHLNDGEPIENPIWNLRGFTGVSYIDNVSQDGFISNIVLTDIYGVRFGVRLTSITTRPTLTQDAEQNKENLIAWITNELIQHQE